MSPLWLPHLSLTACCNRPLIALTIVTVSSAQGAHSTMHQSSKTTRINHSSQGKPTKSKLTAKPLKSKQHKKISSVHKAHPHPSPDPSNSLHLRNQNEHHHSGKSKPRVFASTTILAQHSFRASSHSTSCDYHLTKSIWIVENVNGVSNNMNDLYRKRNNWSWSDWNEGLIKEEGRGNNGEKIGSERRRDGSCASKYYSEESEVASVNAILLGREIEVLLTNGMRKIRNGRQGVDYQPVP